KKSKAGAQSTHVAAAVDVDRLAGDVRSRVAGEKENQPNEIFQLQDVAKRVRAQPLHQFLFSPVATGQSSHRTEKELMQRLRSNPLGHVLEPEDFVRPVLF